jgi:WD40 repeat protein
MFNKIYEFKAGNDGILTTEINNTNLYTAGEDNYIRIWDLNSYQKLKEVEAHSKDISSIKLSPDKNSLFSASNDGFIKQWDNNLNLIYEYEPHSSNVNTIDFLNEKEFVSASDDSTIRIYKIRSNGYKEIKSNAGDINAIKITDDYIFAGGLKLIIYNKKFREIKTNDNYIYGINLIKEFEDKIYISTSMEKYLEVWDKKSLNLEKRLKLKSWINDMTFKNDKIFIANANIISVFDKDLNLIEENENHSDEVYSLQFYDNKLITASNDSFVRIWKVN